MIASTIEKALAACLTEPIEIRLKLLGDTINAVEKRDLKATNRLCGRLTSVIAALKKDASANSEQLSKVAGYAVRVRAFNPRRNAKQPQDEAMRGSSSRIHPPDHAEWFDEQRRKILSVPPVEDGFVRGFVDPIAAVDRVSLRYSRQPPWTFIEQEKVLQTALGDIPLDADAVRQLWLSLAYDFAERLNCAEGSLTPEARWVTSSICAYTNRYEILIPTPNCFTNLFEELAFRA